MQADKKYLLALTRVSQIGPVRLRRLLRSFSDPQKLWEASASELKQAGLEQHIIDNLVQGREEINPDALLAELAEHNLSVVFFNDDDYPPLLAEIYNPPIALYYRGCLTEDNLPLAVVGTRKISPYGTQVVKDLIPQLVQQQITTISGLALGVDSLVHHETMIAGGRTVAVMGGGLDNQNMYPSTNRYLAKRIIESGGLIVSEYPPGTMPRKEHFPNRNRIISGLSRGVLVIEGGENSGSLITARCALDQNREVMAIPGSIYARQSAGANELIIQGAQVVRNIADIITCLNIQEIKSENTATALEQLTEKEQKIISQLSREPSSLDDIIRATNLPAAETVATLNILITRGVIRELKHNQYIKLT